MNNNSYVQSRTCDVECDVQLKTQLVLFSFADTSGVVQFAARRMALQVP
jgi:hypothetical protein